MKRILLLSAACLMLMSLQAQQEFVNLGLPSGTLWKSQNESDLYSYNTAMATFGDNMPTSEQFEELMNSCHWVWQSVGFKVIGPNGNSIFMPAEGYRDCKGNYQENESIGSYWSSTHSESGRAWACYFTSNRKGVGEPERCSERSVRLVQKN